jgi:SAM-dependent methyltransferase
MIRFRANLKRSLKKLYYFGSQRHCPVCGSDCRTFRSFGSPARLQAQCPICGSLERHRLVWLYFQRQTNLFDGREKRVLHIAPELCLETRLKPLFGDAYITADLLNPRAMVMMDITDIQYPDESFDVIYCSHVLEHIVDDHKAMQEFQRVLKPGGWALPLVPITAKTTIEDPAVTDPQERLRLYGQEDHVRRYGLDYADRLRAAGFEVSVSLPGDFLEADEIERMVLGARHVFFCQK